MTEHAQPKHEHHDAELEHIEDTNSGTLRASIFGASDGLVSNLALVMGVAGGSHDPSAIVLAGCAGLLAGAFSMAAGEYVSMQTQRETMERQLEVEREHIERYPEEEQAHLGKLLEQSGLERSEARALAARVHEDVDLSVDFHALHELGIVPEQMGSPATAAIASFFSFVAGAAIPLIPWLIVPNALLSSIGVSALALVLVGAGLTRITNRNAIVGGARQLLFGGGAAAVTYAIGTWVGALI
jgi:VIT1/CCC1 family predicted Fe2+/Mn2+ transporter